MIVVQQQKENLKYATENQVSDVYYLITIKQITRLVQHILITWNVTTFWSNILNHIEYKNDWKIVQPVLPIISIALQLTF